jgi:hypothetical protein
MSTLGLSQYWSCFSTTVLYLCAKNTIAWSVMTPNAALYGNQCYQKEYLVVIRVYPISVLIQFGIRLSVF